MKGNISCVIMLKSLSISMLVALDGIWGSVLQLLGKVGRAAVMQHICLRPKGGVRSPCAVTGL